MAIRQQQITAEGKLRRHECPRCSARVGEPCHTPSWYVYHQGHKERRALAGVG